MNQTFTFNKDIVDFERYLFPIDLQYFKMVQEAPAYQNGSVQILHYFERFISLYFKMKTKVECNCS